MSLRKISELYTEWFKVCPNITSKFRTIFTFNRFVSQNNDTSKTCSYVHDILLYQTSFV
jgi:hypothetical protein